MSVVVDTSAVVAILFKEPGHVELIRKIVAQGAVIGAPTALEASVVLDARGGTLTANDAHALLGRLGVVTVPFDEACMRVARDGFRRYGKGRHPASLNFGDCMSYAVSRLRGEPLLFVGNDFPQTDVLVA